MPYLTKFTEFSIDDFRKYISPKTIHFQKQRQSIKGKEIKIAKIVSFDFDTNTLTIKTEPTYDFDVWTLPDGKTGDNGVKDKEYTIQIELVDFDKWKDSEWNTMKLSEFKEILKLVDIKLNCSCYSFFFQGHRYELSSLDSAIYPYDGPDSGLWRKQRHENKAGLCKHLAAVMPFLNFHAPAILKVIREGAKKER